MTTSAFPLRRTLLLGGIGLLLVVLVVWRILQASATPEPAPTVEQIRDARGTPVTVATVARGPLAVWQEFSGGVTGARDAEVLARADDRIADVRVQVGETVARGQALLTVANEMVDARVRQATLAVQTAERALERAKALLEAGAISAQQFEQAETQLALSRADVAAAREPAVLTSPLAGVVTEVLVRPGMIPRNGDALVRIADLSSLVVRLHLSAADAGQVRQGQAARVRGGEAAGRVRRVALQADPNTRLVEVEVAFSAGARLIPGTLATVEIETARRDEALQVPAGAVRAGAAWVVDEENRARRRDVRIGVAGAGRLEVLEGLQLGERVVVEGATLLSEGAQVRVVGGGAD